MHGDRRLRATFLHPRLHPANESADQNTEGDEKRADRGGEQIAPKRVRTALPGRPRSAIVGRRGVQGADESQCPIRVERMGRTFLQIDPLSGPRRERVHAETGSKARATTDEALSH
jgi:hypothetical protein